MIGPRVGLGRPLGIGSVMDSLAIETWQKVQHGDASGIKFREDSITDHNLLRLHLQVPELNVHRFNQVEEKSSGADWEWWVGSNTSGWYCLRIQAKRVHGTSYKYLDHPGDAPGDYQYDSLIDTCAPMSAVYPFHVFYNGWDQRRFAGDDAAAIDRSLYAPKPPFSTWLGGVGRWGCTAMSSHQVRRLHSDAGRDRSKVLRYLESSMPWSQLFTHGMPHPAGGSTSLVDSLHAYAYYVTLRATADYTDGDVEEAMQNFEGASLRRGLPDYAQAVRDNRPADTQNLDLSVSTVCVLDYTEFDG